MAASPNSPGIIPKGAEMSDERLPLTQRPSKEMGSVLHTQKRPQLAVFRGEKCCIQEGLIHPDFRGWLLRGWALDNS